MGKEQYKFKRINRNLYIKDGQVFDNFILLC